MTALDLFKDALLLHGLKGLHGTRIAMPRRREQWPNPQRLELRWKRFKAAG
jgi:hypothetical protein